VSPVKYELEFYIPEDGILHSHLHKNLKSYTISRFNLNPFLVIRDETRGQDRPQNRRDLPPT
jgi:hypothetical protein